MKLTPEISELLKDAAHSAMSSPPDLRCESFVAYLSGALKRHDPALSDLLWSVVSDTPNPAGAASQAGA